MSNTFDPAPWGQNSGPAGSPQDGYPPVYSATEGTSQTNPAQGYPTSAYTAPGYPPAGYPPAGYPTASYPPAGYPPGFAGPFGPPPPTNGLAIAALVTSFIVAPVGIVLGHVALGQIRRRGEQGRGLAIGGLAVGYIGTAIALIWIIATVAFVNAVSKDFKSFSSYTPTTTTTPNLAPSESIDQAINNSDVGDCLFIASSNGTITAGYRTTCGTTYSRKRVVSRHPGTSSYATYCPNDYVYSSLYNVLLCTTDD